MLDNNPASCHERRLDGLQVYYDGTRYCAGLDGVISDQQFDLQVMIVRPFKPTSLAVSIYSM